MKMYLLRHGETEEGKKNVILGHLPGTLTKGGKRYAYGAGELINNLPVPPDIIIASDLKRAKDTAEIIGRVTKIPVKFDALLRERKGGDVEGMSEDQIDWEKYENETQEYRKHKNGESFVEVRERVDDFLKKIPKDSKQTIAIVSHSVVIAMIISSVLGWGYEKSLDFKFDDSVILLDTKRKEIEIFPLIE